MRMMNAEGRAIYYNPVTKRGKTRYIIKSIDGTPIIGRDKQKRQSRTFTQEAQAEAWLRRQGFKAV